MDVLRIYQDYGVEHLTEGHKHCSNGFVNTQCPHCTGNFGYHLGWNMYENYFRCRRCGWKPMIKTLALLLNLSEREIYPIVKGYGVLRSFVKQPPKGKKEFLLPSNLTELKGMHKRYLKDRKFNPKEIERIWGVKGSGPLSSLDNKDYRFRIIIPFRWNGEVGTFDSRDVTDKQQNKYYACPKEREAIEHKKILYGNQEAWEDTGICIEGPTDVWRFGEATCATSGIEYTQEQVRELANAFKKVAVCYDDEPQAQKNARRLIKDLQFRNVDAYNIRIKGDPGSMSQSKANKLVKNILNK